MKQKEMSAVLLTLALLGGCTAPVSETVFPAPTLSEPVWEAAPTRIACRIVDGAAEGELLLAELDRGFGEDTEESRQDGKSVYRLSLGGETCREESGADGNAVAVTSPEPVSIYLDGRPATAADLADGMPVEVAFMGTVAETFPARLEGVYELHAWSIGSRQNPGGSYYDLCGLYLQVLDDLWEKDPGLNAGITVAGLDLSLAPGGLLDSEKAALAWRFGEKHGVEVVEGTFEELAEGGYLTRLSPEGASPLYQWEDGCLFTIVPDHSHDGEICSGLPVLFFNARKWCSPLGAYSFEDCSAVWPEAGTWSGYQVGWGAIS